MRRVKQRARSHSTSTSSVHSGTWRFGCCGYVAYTHPIPFQSHSADHPKNSPIFKDVKVTYTPILLGGLHKACGNLAPILITNKKEWIDRERERWADIFQIPLRKGVPRGFPVSTVGAMRVLTALGEEVEPEVFARAIEVFWSALWNPEAEVLRGVKSEDGEFNIKDPAVLRALLSRVDEIGGDLAARVVERMADKEVKDKLVANTNTSFKAGAFGIPWFQCVNSRGETEGFWGFDHVGQVVRFLGLEEGADFGRSGKHVKALL